MTDSRCLGLRLPGTPGYTTTAGATGTRVGKQIPPPRLWHWESRRVEITYEHEEVFQGERTSTTNIAYMIRQSRKVNSNLSVARQSDDWNNTLAHQVASDPVESCTRMRWHRIEQNSATVAALVGINPQDELEGMMAAQLIAAHNAAMECYRRAMISDQTFERSAGEPEPGEQALPYLDDPSHSPQSLSRQGPAEGDSRTRTRSQG